MIRLKPGTATYEIDTDKRKVFLISSEVKGKKVIEHRMMFKGFTTLNEAYSYLSEVECVPVWKLRLMSKKMEAQK